MNPERFRERVKFKIRNANIRELSPEVPDIIVQ